MGACYVLTRQKVEIKYEKIFVHYNFFKSKFTMILTYIWPELGITI